MKLSKREVDIILAMFGTVHMKVSSLDAEETEIMNKIESLTEVEEELELE